MNMWTFLDRNIIWIVLAVACVSTSAVRCNASDTRDSGCHIRYGTMDSADGGP